MHVINKEIMVHAPVHAVFDFLYKPDNIPKVWPSLVAVTNQQPLPGGGYSFHWQYQMGGISFIGAGKYTNVNRNQWIVVETKGAIDCIFTWTLRARKRYTKLFLTMEYGIPIPILGWIAEKTFVQMNEDEAGLILSNIKKLMEAKYPVTASSQSVI